MRSDTLHLVGIVVMMFSLLGLKAYEHREDVAVLGGIGMMAAFLLIMLFCLFADARDARRDSRTRRR